MPNPLTRDAVLQAIAEFDRIGRPAFLAKYDHGQARDYFLVVAGKNYDSKAIAGAAYGYMPGGEALNAYGHTGGITDAAAKLKELGFIITKPGQNADWTWDEHVLGLDLYFRVRGTKYSQNSPDILELSHTLNVLGERRGVLRTPKYRNANGVYKKLGNFRAVDPDDPAKGLENGSKLEGKVWAKYKGDLVALTRDAGLIRLAISDSTVAMDIEDEDQGVEEGDIVYRLHRSRERAPGLAARKRADVIKKLGVLHCEACAFDFVSRYGDLGAGFMEVHHNDPVALSEPGRRTKLRDLAVVCANCHRMLHRGARMSVAELRALIELKNLGHS